MLKLFVKSLSEVDEAYHSLYEGNDEDGYTLKTDDGAMKKQLDEFRRNNRLLYNQKKALEEAAVKYKDVDLDKYNLAVEALDKVNALEEADLLKEGKLDEIVANRTDAMKTDFDSQIKAKATAFDELTGENTKLRGRLGGLLIDTAVQTEVNSAGKLRAGAMPDVQNRARNTWRIDAEGNMVALDSKGDQKYGKDGDPLTMKEWAGDLIVSATHLFEPGKGGGAGGSDDTNRQREGGKVDGSDPVEFGKHLEDIASGKASVKPPVAAV